MMERRSFFGRLLAVLGAAAGVPGRGAASPLPAPNAEAMPASLPIPAGPWSPSPRASAEIPGWLRHWRSLPRYPLWDEVMDPALSRLIEAAEGSLPVRLIYDGGSTPGAVREFTPHLVFQVTEPDTEWLPNGFPPIYISGWCHERRAHRTLRFDRLRLVAGGGMGAVGAGDLVNH